MVASHPATDAIVAPVSAPSAEPAGLPAGAEAAFREALTESFHRLELCDRNLLRFHYFHGLTVDQLAVMLSLHRATVLRQLTRIRERLLRDSLRGVSARLHLDRRALDQLAGVAHSRFARAIGRVLRS